MKTKIEEMLDARIFNGVISNFKKISFTLLGVLLTFILSCEKNDEFDSDGLGTNDNLLFSTDELESKKQNANAVMHWNLALQELYTFPLGVGTSPVSTSYTWALVHLAMHDALNSITPRYQTYGNVARDKDANPDAAVSQAAYDVIMAINQLPFGGAYVPQNLEKINTLLKTTLDNIPDSEAKTKGILLGHVVAKSIMDKRTNDFPNLVPASINQPMEGTLTGEYRYLPFPPAPNGRGYAFPNFGNLTPFFILTNDMFRPGPPYAINSPQYTADFNEVKDLGSENSVLRTNDQTELGVFWAENSNRGWNEIARQVLSSYNAKSQNAWKTARYFALIHAAIADSYISIFNSKRYYYTWRPISAIHFANTDGNNETVGDVNWKSLLTTPPVAEYPSAHAISGASAGQVIYRYFDNRDHYIINQNSGYMPGVIREFSSISDAVRENSLSRIYIGYHFRQAVNVGESLGKKLGDYVYKNALKEQ